MFFTYSYYYNNDYRITQSPINILNLPKKMAGDEKFPVDVNRIQAMCCRSQFSYFKPPFIFEHSFKQVIAYRKGFIQVPKNIWNLYLIWWYL